MPLCQESFMVIQDRNFGCEFEFSTMYHDFLPIAKQAVDEIYGYGCFKHNEKWYESNNNFKQWHLKLDSSTESELCTPVSKLNNLEEIVSVMSKIGKNKTTKITKNDSFHVHMDVKDMDREAILVLWMRYEKIIFSLFPPNRRNHNEYCESSILRKKRSKNISEYLKEAIENTQDHHSAISFYFYNHKEKMENSIHSINSERNTVEFRLGEGTTDASFIRNWVTFLLYFLDSCKALELKDIVDIMCDKMYVSGEENLIFMLEELEIKDKTVRRWVFDRYRKNNHK